MPAAKPRVSLPIFSRKEIKQANDCALLIWNGTSYIDGKEIISDRFFLTYFSHEFSKIITPKSGKFHLQPSIIHDLIIVSLFKPMLRKSSEHDFNALDNFFRKNIKQLHQNNTNISTSLDRVQISSQIVLGAGKAVVKPNVSVKAGYRVPFASRLLFFGMPEFLVFNYANQLCEKKLGYQSRPHVAYPYYANDMLQCLRNNWTELSRYNIPTEIPNQPEPQIKIVHQSHWWARRVLDLALLIKFQVFRPIPINQSMIKGMQYYHQIPSTCAKP